MIDAVEITNCDFKSGRPKRRENGLRGSWRFGLLNAFLDVRDDENSMKDIEIIPLAKRKMERRSTSEHG